MPMCVFMQVVLALGWQRSVSTTMIIHSRCVISIDFYTSWCLYIRNVYPRARDFVGICIHLAYISIHFVKHVNPVCGGSTKSRVCIVLLAT